MDQVGLFQRFKINRPLTLAEAERQLKPKIKTGVKPYYFWSTIRCNSTFLELSDKFYPNKGLVTLVMLIGIPLIFALVAFMSVVIFTDIFPSVDEKNTNLYLFGSCAILFCLGVLVFAVWVLRKESFAYTHYPIRFNRKARMVYVFRLNGTVLTAPWDKLFFTICSSSTFMGIRYWDLRAHVLDADGITVRETFALPRCVPDNAHTQQKALWEYIRRYMEDRDGVASTVARTPMYLPLPAQRESWLFGLRRFLVEGGAGLVFLRWFLLPFALPISFGRWFAMRTSRIPQWPKEIEDVCQITPNDPYERDERNNPADLWPVMKHVDWDGEERPSAKQNLSA